MQQNFTDWITIELNKNWADLCVVRILIVPLEARKGVETGLIFLQKVYVTWLNGMLRVPLVVEERTKFGELKFPTTIGGGFERAKCCVGKKKWGTMIVVLIRDQLFLVN